jgi:ABC-type nitrate/sulfonate/bicarbonate transport system permease component
VAVVLLWQGTVSYFRIPAFLVPSPLVMLDSLWRLHTRLAGLQQTVLQLTGIQGKGRTDAERLAAREKILYPTLVAVAVVLLWQGTVSYFRIPAFLVPSPRKNTM